MRYILSVVLVAFLMVGCSTGQKVVNSGIVTQSDSQSPNGHGLWYYLPKTVIKVTVTAEKQVQKSGPFYRYAQRFLNLTDVITEDHEKWVLTGARVSTEGVADRSRLFHISTKGQPGMAVLNRSVDGVLLSVNAQPVKRKRLMSVNVPGNEIDLNSINFNEAPFTEDQLIKTSTTAMAEEVAKEIYRLRALRQDILEGNADQLPPDGQSYRITLDEINRLEKACLELFIGKKEVQEVVHTYIYTPSAGSDLNSVLFRFSEAKGFVDASNLTGTPVYIQVEASTSEAVNYVAQEDKKESDNRGLVYCEPVAAQVKIIDRTLLLTSEQVLLAQFGKLLRLPADLLDTPQMGVQLQPETGALVKVVRNYSIKD
ncbi:DUF4831 family protein [Geofilum sp. OHC36d9]|uniref:DUF4831 family protein n=1 Tax=Geofilum sp. OHC36d9 TaxID=3458413 RepID=UPI0040338436